MLAVIHGGVKKNQIGALSGSTNLVLQRGMTINRDWNRYGRRRTGHFLHHVLPGQFFMLCQAHIAQRTFGVADDDDKHLAVLEASLQRRPIIQIGHLHPEAGGRNPELAIIRNDLLFFGSEMLHPLAVGLEQSDEQGDTEHTQGHADVTHDEPGQRDFFPGQRSA